MTQAETLAYYDKKAPTKVIADASPVGLGAVLVQKQSGREVAIAYASRSLSKCERRYSQTEKEALALVCRDNFRLRLCVIDPLKLQKPHCFAFCVPRQTRCAIPVSHRR